MAPIPLHAQLIVKQTLLDKFILWPYKLSLITRRGKKKNHAMEGQGLLWQGNSAWWALLPLKAAWLFPDGCLERFTQTRRIWMSPVSVVAPSKCHGSRRYMAVMQSRIKAKTATNLLDISGELTVKNYHCHLLSSSFGITAVDLCTWIYKYKYIYILYICVWSGLCVCVSGEKMQCKRKDDEKK